MESFADTDEMQARKGSPLISISHDPHVPRRHPVGIEKPALAAA